MSKDDFVLFFWNYRKYFLAIFIIFSIIAMVLTVTLTEKQYEKKIYYSADNFSSTQLSMLKDNFNYFVEQNKLSRKFDSQLTISTDKDIMPKGASENPKQEIIIILKSNSLETISRDDFTNLFENKLLLPFLKNSFYRDLFHDEIIKYEKERMSIVSEIDQYSILINRFQVYLDKLKMLSKTTKYNENQNNIVIMNKFEQLKPQTVFTDAAGDVMTQIHFLPVDKQITAINSALTSYNVAYATYLERIKDLDKILEFYHQLFNRNDFSDFTDIQNLENKIDDKMIQNYVKMVLGYNKAWESYVCSNKVVTSIIDLPKHLLVKMMVSVVISFLFSFMIIFCVILYTSFSRRRAQG